MYRNIVLTLMLIVAIVIAIELGRPRRVPASPSDPAETRFAAARALLERRIPELKLRGMTVGQAIDEIHRKSGVPILANWKSIEVLRDLPVDIDFHDVALGDALYFILYLDRSHSDFANVPEAEFDVVNGTVVVANEMDNQFPTTFPPGVMIARCYDVRDLLTDSYWGYPSTGELPKQGNDRLTALAGMVEGYAGMENYTYTYSTLTWAPPSGMATIKPFAGRLLIVQTAYGHILIERFLARLRATGRSEAAR